MKIKLILYSISLYLIVSCGTTHCPSFPDELQGYLPYEKNQVIQFYNIDGDTINLEINSNSITEPESFSKRCACECVVEKNIISNEDTINKIILNSNISLIGENKNYLDIKIQLNSSYGKYTNNTIDYSKSNSIIGDTILFSKYVGNDFSNIIVVYNKGLVSFYDNRYNCTWHLVE